MPLTFRAARSLRCSVAAEPGLQSHHNGGLTDERPPGRTRFARLSDEVATKAAAIKNTTGKASKLIAMTNHSATTRWYVAGRPSGTEPGSVGQSAPSSHIVSRSLRL